MQSNVGSSFSGVSRFSEKCSFHPNRRVERIFSLCSRPLAARLLPVTVTRSATNQEMSIAVVRRGHRLPKP